MSEGVRIDKWQSLDDLAFKGRNTAYGAYYLRNKYPRYLLIGLLAGIFIFSTIILTAFLLYYMEGADMDLVEWNMEVVEVIPMPPPENKDLLGAALPNPPPEETPQPVVRDSVTEPLKENTDRVEDNQEEKKDTAGKSGSGNGSGDEGSGDNTIYTVIDVFPRFPGGDQARLYFLRTHIRYPEIAIRNMIQGVVILVFVIEPDGTITNVQVAKGIGGGCDDEAVRVAKGMPRWDPGKRNGRAVRVMVRMPIVFRIPGK